MNIKLCAHKAKACAEKAGGKTHILYLVIATVFDGPLLLRLATGGCLVFCLLATFLRDEDERREAQPKEEKI